MDLFRKVIWSNSCLLSGNLQFSSQVSRQWQLHPLANTSQINYLTDAPGEVLSCASLREAKISEDERPTSVTQPAVPASQALFVILWSPISTLQASRVLHVSCLSTCIQSARVLESGNKLQHTATSFWCISLHGFPTNAM